jgi:hypothetical protein
MDGWVPSCTLSFLFVILTNDGGDRVGLSSHVEEETEYDDGRTCGLVDVEYFYTSAKQLQWVLHFTMELRFTDISFFS